ncbi:alpha/beta fold hydrolase [Streptomyces sp. SCPE 10]
MPDLAQNHTVVVPDLRGTGDSDRPEDGYARPTRPTTYEAFSPP